MSAVDSSRGGAFVGVGLMRNRRGLNLRSVFRRCRHRGKAEWHEEDHERDEAGRFSEGGGHEYGRQEGESARQWSRRLAANEPDEPSEPDYPEAFANAPASPEADEAERQGRWDDYGRITQEEFAAWAELHPEEASTYIQAKEEYDAASDRHAAWDEATYEAEQAVEKEDDESEQAEIRKEYRDWQKRQAKRDKKREIQDARVEKLREALEKAEAALTDLDIADAEDSEPDAPDED